MSGGTRITWLINSLGYNNQLLYWEPILSGFVSKFPETTFLTCDTAAKIRATGHEVRKILPKCTLNTGQHRFYLPLPITHLKLARTKPNLVIISEFGLLSFYAACYRLLNPKSRLLLLVESDPVYLNNYGIHRNSNIHTITRRLITRAVDKILCNNISAENYVVRCLGVSYKKVRQSCYLTSSISSGPCDRLKKRNEFVLLYVGQLIKRKGLHHLIRAITIIPSTQRRFFKLDIVGDGPDRDFFLRLIQQYGIEHIVTLHGSQPYEKISEFYRRADLFVLPTMGDYRALVGFEALSAGLPIIDSIFDGAATEIVEEGVNGFIVNPADEVAFAEKIQLFLKMPELSVQFGKASKRKAESFTTSVAVNNLVEASMSCLAL